MKCFIGIDLGSTTTKAVVMDDTGTALGHGITNSRSNYDTAALVAKTEALISARLVLLRQALDKELQEIDADFAFIAECNLGGEFIPTGEDERQTKVERLETIAAKTWERTLDDRIGISWEEEKRRARTAKQELPAVESLIADRPDHLIHSSPRCVPRPRPWSPISGPSRL